jgi:ribonuclease HI
MDVKSPLVVPPTASPAAHAAMLAMFSPLGGGKGYLRVSPRALAPPTPKTVPEIVLKHRRMISEALADPNCRVCFTDGSCIGNPGFAGAAAILINVKDAERSLPDLSENRSLETKVADYAFTERATNNRAELKGLDLALTLLEALPKGAKRWIIMTDSEYVRGLFVDGHTARANVEAVNTLKQRIQTLTETHGVVIEFAWVKAHKGVYFNVQADKVARAAAKRAQQQLRKKRKHPPTKNRGSSNQAKSQTS